MKTKTVVVFSLVFLSALTFCIGLVASANAQNPVAQKVRFEYKVIGDNNRVDVETMNQLGDDGWELVTSETWRVSNQLVEIRHIFKRVR